MFIEVVHINGTYDPAAQRHEYGAFSVELARISSATERAVRAGWDILYLSNLNGNAPQIMADPDMTAAALASDLFLSRLSPSTQERVMTRFEGYPYSPLDHNAQTVAIEDELARKHRMGFIVGAFATDCVRTKVLTITARNPGVELRVDPHYCVYRAGTGRFAIDGVRLGDLNSYLTL